MLGVTRRVVFLGAFATAVLGVACSIAFPLDVFQSGHARPVTPPDAEVDATRVPSCEVKRPPPHPDHDDESPTPDIGSIVFAARSSSASSDSGVPPSSYGYDLDNYCTCGGTVPDPQSCTLPKRAPKNCDQEGGLDNTAAPIVKNAADLAGGFGLGNFEKYVNEGTATMLIQVTGYNGMPNDTQVVVGIIGAAYRMADGVTPTDRAPPNWDGKDVWSVMEASLQPNSSLPRAVDQEAYVSGGVLVTRLGSSTLSDAGLGDSLLLGIANHVTDGYITGRIVKEANIWQLHDALIAGRVPVDHIFALLASGSSTACKGQPAYLYAQTQICPNRDIAADPAQDGRGFPCDAVSFGIGFEATQAQRGVIGITRPIDAGCGEDYTDSCKGL
jgi:hypothetical protein